MMNSKYVVEDEVVEKTTFIEEDLIETEEINEVCYVKLTDSGKELCKTFL